MPRYTLQICIIVDGVFLQPHEVFKCRFLCQEKLVMCETLYFANQVFLLFQGMSSLFLLNLEWCVYDVERYIMKLEQG